MLNKCEFIGNLGGDPEMRFMANGDGVCNFSVACTETWKDKTTGEPKEQTEWVRVSAWGRLAETCNEFLSKGSRAYVEGKMQTRKYQAADGTDRYSTDIRAKNVIFLDRKGEGPQQNAAPEQAGQPAPSEESFSEDIPF